MKRLVGNSTFVKMRFASSTLFVFITNSATSCNPNQHHAWSSNSTTKPRTKVRKIEEGKEEIYTLAYWIWLNLSVLGSLSIDDFLPIRTNAESPIIEKEKDRERRLYVEGINVNGAEDDVKQVYIESKTVRQSDEALCRCVWASPPRNVTWMLKTARLCIRGTQGISVGTRGGWY